MVGWHHWLNGHEFEQTPGHSEKQGSLACCSPWGRKESDMTEQLNNNRISDAEHLCMHLLATFMSSLETKKLSFEFWYNIKKEYAFLSKYISVYSWIFFKDYNQNNISGMVNFMCQVHWATRCSDIWLNSILGVSGRVFLNKKNIWNCTLSEADCPFQCGGLHPIHWGPE